MEKYESLKNSFLGWKQEGVFLHCVTVKINHLLCRWREYLQIKATPVLN